MRINAAEGNLDKQGLFTTVDEDKKTDKNSKSEENGKNIYAGNMNIDLNFESKIEQKRKQAQKQAMKLISDAFSRDEAYADNTDKLRALHAEKVAESVEENDKIKEFENQKEELRKQYGVDENSEEQRDLELLEKYQNARNGVRFESFSEDEINRLKELQNMPRTEYQNRVLELNQAQGVATKKLDDIQQEIKLLSESVTDANIEQLKSQDMLKSQKASDEIVDAAEDEILGILIQDAKDNIDETAEEEQEKAEEAAEKKEEREERIEEQREERKEQEELLSGIADSDELKQETAATQSVTDSVKIAQKNIKKIIEENNLLDDDLKGIEIDLDF